ncbi:MAG: hypothetical protein KIS67_27280 [Verrucomicrobiae bacterium]|nr:hypothetical protein [Verrucomicrobiae bacterium]
MGARDGIYKNVDDAPFRIGDKVRVVFLADETADRKFLRRVGTVHYFEYTRGCGQRFPHDPMIGVKFARCFEEFWKEELRLIKRAKGCGTAERLSRRAAFSFLRKAGGEDRVRLLTW